MKTHIFYTLLLVLCLCVSAIYAQTETAESNVAKVNPYKVGEHLTFVGKYKKFGLSFTVADFNFTVSKASNDKDYFIKSEATSRGTLVKLFGFKFLQRFESTVDADNLRILKTVKKDVQRKRIRDSKADFDYQDKKVTWVETDPNDPSRPPKRVASTVGPNTQDIVTAVYMLRQMPLAVGKRFILKVSDSGLVYDVPIKVTARERRKSILGKLWCWKIEPEIFGEGNFIEQKGSLTFWITDDSRRIPVYAKLNTRLGGIHIKLKKVTKIQTTLPNKK